MFGFGTILNVAAILLGGLLGGLFGKLLKQTHQDALSKACGICVLFIGIGGALEGMLTVTDGKVISGNGLLIIGSLAIGGLIGELLNIEGGFERFGTWLRDKTGNGKDNRFVDGFVTASLTVCIGAMAIVGAIEDGLTGDYSILATKAVLDLIIILVMTWRWTGTNMIYFLSGLQNIDDSLYEAAAIDGATGVQAFTRITMPLLKPTILLTTITSTTGTMKLFDEVYNITGGGPANGTITLSNYLYQLCFGGVPQYGYASAIAYIIFLIAALLAFIQMKVGDKE